MNECVRMCDGQTYTEGHARPIEGGAKKEKQRDGAHAHARVHERKAPSKDIDWKCASIWLPA